MKKSAYFKKEYQLAIKKTEPPPTYIKLVGYVLNDAIAFSLNQKLSKLFHLILNIFVPPRK